MTSFLQITDSDAFVEALVSAIERAKKKEIERLETPIGTLRFHEDARQSILWTMDRHGLIMGAGEFVLHPKGGLKACNQGVLRPYQKQGVYTTMLKAAVRLYKRVESDDKQTEASYMAWMKVGALKRGKVLVLRSHGNEE